MEGDQWVDHAGHTWQLLPRGDSAGGKDGPDGDTVVLGLSLDYGEADEPPARLGTLELLCAALGAGLVDAVGASGPLRVGVSHYACETEIRLLGARASVLEAWDLLGGYMTGREPLPPTQEVARQARQQGASRCSGWSLGPGAMVPWPRDLVRLTGPCTLILSRLRLSGAVRAGEAGDAAVRALIAHLAPGTGQVRHVFFTDDPQLVGAGWAARPSYGIAPARPALPVPSRPALVDLFDDTDDPSVLFTLHTAPGPLGMAVFQLFVSASAASLEKAGTDVTMSTTLVSLRDATYLTVRLPGQLAQSVRCDVVEAAVLGSGPLTEKACAHAAQMAGTTWPEAWRRLRLSGRPVPPSLGAQDVRQAYEQMMATAHVPLDHRTRDLPERYPAGFQVVEDDEVPALTGAALPHGPAIHPDLPHVVEVGPRTVTTLWYDWQEDSQGRAVRGAPLFRRQVRLDRLVVTATDADSSYLILVDERMRVVCLPWADLAAYPRLAAALQGEGTWTAPRMQVGDWDRALSARLGDVPRPDRMSMVLRPEAYS